MDEFILPIDANKFRSTNGKWNELHLNDPWSVGYVSTLIELQEWQSKEEWERFYYNSGAERARLLGSNAALLENYLLTITHSGKIASLPWGIKNLNTQYGRTVDDLRRRAQTLYNAVKNNGYGLTEEDCFQCVRFRVICETWNGIILRENNTIETLKRLFPMCEFRKVPGEIDHTYAVDFEVVCNGRLICALQIKPKSYTWNAPYIQKARYANTKKNTAYTNKFGVPVWNVISTSKGVIQNEDVISKIRSIIPM